MEYVNKKKKSDLIANVGFMQKIAIVIPIDKTILVINYPIKK